MKKIITAIILLSLTVIMPLQAAPSSYVLMCKGGGNMNIDYNSSTNYLTVNFKAGRQSGSHGVPAGTCTWVDRGFRAGEPKRLCQIGVNDVKFHMNSSDKITQLRSMKAPYISNILSGRSFQVRVYNDGSGCMKITRAGV